MTVAVKKHGSRRLIHHCIDGSDEGKGGDQHNIAGAHAEVPETQMEPRRAGLAGAGLGNFQGLCHLLLKPADKRAGGGNPFRVNGLIDILFFISRKIRDGETDCGVWHSGGIPLFKNIWPSLLTISVRI